MKPYPILTTLLITLTVGLWAYAALPHVRAQIEKHFPSESEQEDPKAALETGQEQPAPFQDPGTFSPLPEKQSIAEKAFPEEAPGEPEFPPLAPIDAPSPVAPDPFNPSPEDGDLPQEGSLLDQVRRRLVSYRGVEADVVQRLAIGSRELKCTGHYLQGTNLRIRMELEIESGSSRATLLEVCDGHVLWTRRIIDENQLLTRRDVRQILTAASNSAHVEQNLLRAELGLGGLPALLASLDHAFTFSEPTTETIQGHRLKVIRGTWKEDVLKQVSGSPAKLPSKNPVYLPDEVRLYVDEETLFPRRLHYLKLSSQEKGYRTLSTLDFVEVVLNPTLDEQMFEFVPPDGVIPTDVTHQYLQTIDRSAD